MRKWLRYIFRRVVQSFWGKGITKTLPFVGTIYFFVTRHLIPRGVALFQVQGLKIYAEGNSGIAQIMGIRGSYEEDTTKLFIGIVREGMTVLDLGANIGYYSLLAGRQVGEKDKVFAFEPGPESFAILQRNIKANGFNNIVPMAKAVSNRCGRQRLFLASDPGEHGLFEYLDREYIEVDVTTIDEFIKEQNISVDVIKMDVEGGENEVLDGMPETISKTPELKIITEFLPQHFERSGSSCSPYAFLERLMGYGFKLYFIDDKKHTRELITLNNINNLIELSHRGPANIYCARGDI